MKEKIRNYLSLKMDSPIDDIEVANNLDEKTIETISAWQDPSLFFVVNNLHANPTKVQDVPILVAQISALLHIPEETLTQGFTIRKRRHLEIIRKMSISARDMVNKRIETEILALKNKQLDPEDTISSFIKIEDNLVRYYPE